MRSRLKNNGATLIHSHDSSPPPAVPLVRARLAPVAAGLLVVALCGGALIAPASADEVEPTEPTPAPTVAMDAGEAAEGEEANPNAEWGIEITSVRLTANDHMIDFRYRVLDADKAKELFVRQNKPRMVHHETGLVLSVPETAKVGPLRNSNMPKEGKIYWMFFGNAGKLVKPGDTVTVTIGEFEVDDIIVE
jgi:hypothetical protein